jgi:hypothetical protein
MQYKALYFLCCELAKYPSLKSTFRILSGSGKLDNHGVWMLTANITTLTATYTTFALN